MTYLLTQRKVPQGRADEDALTADIIAPASKYGRYGGGRITALLRDARAPEPCLVLRFCRSLDP